MSKAIKTSDKTLKRYEKIGAKIAYYRKVKKITQLDLAERADISRSHLSSIEATGVPHNFSFEVFFRIADALKIPPHLLLVDIDKEDDNDKDDTENE